MLEAVLPLPAGGAGRSRKRRIRKPAGGARLTFGAVGAAPRGYIFDIVSLILRSSHPLTETLLGK